MYKGTVALSTAIVLVLMFIAVSVVQFGVQPNSPLLVAWSVPAAAQPLTDLSTVSVTPIPTATSVVTQSGELGELIAEARATVTPTPTPTVGDPISDGLLWIYVRVPFNKASEMIENGCMIHDDELDQSLYEFDSFVVADEEGTILQQDTFAGTTRIRSEQTAWEPETSDEGWTADDETRWCRLQGGLGPLPYSPVYQVAFGDRARGPYAVSWDSVIRSENRMMLAIDLTTPAEAVVARTPVAVYSGSFEVESVATTTDPIPLTEPLMMVSVDNFLAMGPFTVVAVTDDGRRFTLFKESSDFAGFVNVPDLNGAKTVTFEVTGSGLWTLVAW